VLTNVVKHSGAGHATVRARLEAFRVHVGDDGLGARIPARPLVASGAIALVRTW
jgi:signal transduction histidine kinase